MGKNWKAFERGIAKSVGSERTPLSGGNSKQTLSDTLHQELFIECKHRKSLSVVSLFRATRELAKKEGKEPILALKENGRHGEVAVIDWSFFLMLWEAYKIASAKNRPG